MQQWVAVVQPSQYQTPRQCCCKFCWQRVSYMASSLRIVCARSTIATVWSSYKKTMIKSKKYFQNTYWTQKTQVNMHRNVNSNENNSCQRSQMIHCTNMCAFSCLALLLCSCVVVSDISVSKINLVSITVLCITNYFQFLLCFYFEKLFRFSFTFWFSDHFHFSFNISFYFSFRVYCVVK